MRAHRYVRIAVLGAAVSIGASGAAAQDTPPPPSPSPVTQPPVQTDEAIVNLPTTLSLKAHGSYFRLTHRFPRDLRFGSFGGLVQDLFGLDKGAIIGLEYRYGLTRNLQAGVHRSTFNKSIVLFGRWDAWQQHENRPVGLAVSAAFEGDNNLRQDYQPAASVTISRTSGTRLAVYATPSYVHHAHTDTLLALHEGHSVPGVPIDTRRDTWFVGLGGRLRFLETAYLVVEASPRLAGYDPDGAAWNVGVEKLTHGHVLQLNIGNNFATTPGQIARGGDRHAVFLGFNISRKFF
jgi:hypothetical protein